MNKRITNNDTYTLDNGVEIPVIAFGTGVIKQFSRNKPLYIKDRTVRILKSIKHRKLNRTLKNDYTIKQTLDEAIKCGFRLFDSGRLYGHSESCIGQAISKHNRADFFIATKVSDDDLKRYPNAGTVHENLAISIKNLRSDYVDAYLLHFPEENMISMYKEMESEFAMGVCRSIGVCNFDVIELEKLMEACDINPMINQCELHPLNQKPELRKFCRENHIILMAHTPTSNSMVKKIADTDVMKKLMKKHNKSAIQIIYRWHIENGVIPIVSTTSKEHIHSDFDIFNFSLSEEDMEAMGSLNEDRVLCKYNSKKNDVPNYIYNV